MRKVNRQIVSALIISKDNKLLMGMKDPHKGGVYPNCWHIPGGGIEQGESQIDALQREIIEETGIDISLSQIDLIDDKGTGVSIKKLKDGEEVECQMQFYIYKVMLSKISSKIEISLNDDLEKYLWADLDKLNKYKLTPPSIQLFIRLGWLEKFS